MIYLRLLTNINQIKVYITDCDQFRSLNQPNIFEISASEKNIYVNNFKFKFFPDSFIHLYERKFVVECDSSSFNFSLQSLFDGTLLDNREEELPVSLEILSDSIFCHNHYPLNDNEHNLSRRSLNSFGQIVRMCRNASAQSNFLLESRGESISLIVVHPDFLIGDIKRLESQNTIILRRVSFVCYKYLDSVQNFIELSTLRHSFEVEWYPLSKDLFTQIREKLNYSNVYEVCQVEKSSQYIGTHLKGYSIGFL